MDDYVRRCALPGCDVPIDDIPGRPARRYCTAAHRAAARQARRASMQPDQQARLSETLPWLREPAPEPVLVRPAGVRADPGPAVARPASTPAPSPSRGLAARLGAALPRRRRAIAVIGAAGILAGGYAVTSSQSTEVAGPTQATSAGETSDRWAARAQVTLTSVDRQLDTIAQTEAAWNAVPEHATVGTPPPVAELRQRKALLEQRKVALQSQLDSYRALARTRADLELAEQNLEAVERALRDAPTAGAASSPDQASALAALQEQRDLRIRQRDAKKLELAGIEGSVEKAARTPLPDDGQQTTVVSEKVLDVIHNGGRDGGRPGSPSSPTPGPRRPEVLAGGREGEQGQERQATTTSAPPDPRGPRDESAERRAEPRPVAAPKGPVGAVVDTVDRVAGGGKPNPDTGARSRGPVGKVVDTVGGVLGAGEAKPAAARKPAADKPAAEKPAEQSKGPVGQVVDTVGGAVEGVVGGGESPKQSPPKQTKAGPSPVAKPTANNGSGRAPTPRSAPARTAPAPASTGVGSMPGAEMAMAIVSSVPGGEAAAPAVESALRQAAAQYAAGKSSGSPSSSRKTPTSTRASRSSSNGDGSVTSMTSRSGTAGSGSASSGGSSDAYGSGTSGGSGSTAGSGGTAGSGPDSSYPSGSGAGRFSGRAGSGGSSDTAGSNGSSGPAGSSGSSDTAGSSGSSGTAGTAWSS